MPGFYGGGFAGFNLPTGDQFCSLQPSERQKGIPRVSERKALCGQGVPYLSLPLDEEAFRTESGSMNLGYIIIEQPPVLDLSLGAGRFVE